MKTAIISILISAFAISCASNPGQTSFAGSAGVANSAGSSGMGGNVSAAGSGGMAGASETSYCETWTDCAAPEVCQEKQTDNGIVKVCDVFSCESDSDCPAESFICVRGDCLRSCSTNADCNSNNSCMRDTISNGPKLGVVMVCE